MRGCDVDSDFGRFFTSAFFLNVVLGNCGGVLLHSDTSGFRMFQVRNGWGLVFFQVVWVTARAVGRTSIGGEGLVSNGNTQSPLS